MTCATSNLSVLLLLTNAHTGREVLLHMGSIELPLCDLLLPLHAGDEGQVCRLSLDTSLADTN